MAPNCHKWMLAPTGAGSPPQSRQRGSTAAAASELGMEARSCQARRARRRWLDAAHSVLRIRGNSRHLPLARSPGGDRISTATGLRNHSPSQHESRAMRPRAIRAHRWITVGDAATSGAVRLHDGVSSAAARASAGMALRAVGAISHRGADRRAAGMLVDSRVDAFLQHGGRDRSPRRSRGGVALTCLVSLAVLHKKSACS